MSLQSIGHLLQLSHETEKIDSQSKFSESESKNSVQMQQILLSKYDDPVFCDPFLFLKHLFSTFPTLYRFVHFNK